MLILGPSLSNTRVPGDASSWQRAAARAAARLAQPQHFADQEDPTRGWLAHGDWAVGLARARRLGPRAYCVNGRGSLHARAVTVRGRLPLEPSRQLGVYTIAASPLPFPRTMLRTAF